MIRLIALWPGGWCGRDGVCIMAGVIVPENDDEPLTPDPESVNNFMNLDSAKFFIRNCQEIGVPLTSVSRHTVAGCELPSSILRILRDHGGPVGRTFYEKYEQSVAGLVESVAEPMSAERKLPARCDSQWFENTFLNSQALDPNRCLLEQLAAVRFFTPVIILCSVPSIAERFFEPEVRVVRNMHHKILGKNPEVCGVRPENLLELQMLMSRLMLKGVLMNQSTFSVSREQIHVDGIENASFDIGGPAIPEYIDCRKSQSMRMRQVFETELYTTMSDNARAAKMRRTPTFPQ